MIKISEYFGGAVKSLAYDSPEGRSSVGVIEKGEFEFGTSTPETMIILEGELEALLPGSEEWITFKKGQQFEVSAVQKFSVRARMQTSYLCKYH